MRSIIAILSLSFLVQPAQAQEREWSFDRTDEDAFLIFGTPGTDDVGLSFWCKLGGKRVRLQLSDAGHGHAGARGILGVDIGAQHFTLPTSLSRSNDGRVVAEANVSLTGKVLTALESAPYLSLSLHGHSASFPFDGENVAVLRRACAG